MLLVDGGAPVARVPVCAPGALVGRAVGTLVVGVVADGLLVTRAVGCGAGVGVGLSVRMARGPMGTPAWTSAGPCGAGVGVGLGSGRRNVRADSCANVGPAMPAISAQADAAQRAPALRDNDRNEGLA